MLQQMLTMISMELSGLYEATISSHETLRSVELHLVGSFCHKRCETSHSLMGAFIVIQISLKRKYHPEKKKKHTWILYQLFLVASNQKGQGVCASASLYKQTATLPPAVPISQALPGRAGGGSQ